jgi:hypothetical protein
MVRELQSLSKMQLSRSPKVDVHARKASSFPTERDLSSLLSKEASCNVTFFTEGKREINLLTRARWKRKGEVDEQLRCGRMQVMSSIVEMKRADWRAESMSQLPVPIEITTDPDP